MVEERKAAGYRIRFHGFETLWVPLPYAHISGFWLAKCPKSSACTKLSSSVGGPHTRAHEGGIILGSASGP